MAMLRMARTFSLALAAVLLLTCGLAWADAAKPTYKLAPAAYTKGALPYREIVFTSQKFAFKKIPYFPGSTFISYDCTPHGDERQITVSSSKITLTNRAGLLGGPTKVEYDFATATIRVTRGSSPALTAILYLNYLLDSESPSDIQAFAAAGRQTAISLLDLLRGSLSPFAAKNTLDQCAATGSATRPLVYSPRVKELVAYLKQVSDILAAEKQQPQP